MDDVEIGLHCMRGGMGWHRKIRLVKEAITNIERGYRVTIEGRESVDVEFELKNIKLMLFAMVHDLGVLTTCGASPKTALDNRQIIINAVDDLAKKDFTALNERLRILETFAP